MKALVGRLDLEKYKATIKGLTAFGDRRQGTDRNRAAVDWIEAQLKSFGCTNTERIKYVYDPPPPAASTPATPSPAGSAQSRHRERRNPQRPGRFAVSRRHGADRREHRSRKQPDLKLRELNSQPTTPGPREEVYCTKIGATHPGEMYIVGAHMDGHGWGEAANDNGSGTALVMEIARVFSSPDVQTDRSIRFALWNNEETGYQGAHAYVEQRGRAPGQRGSRGLGPVSGAEMAWHDPARHDALRSWDAAPDGTLASEQRPEADVNVEFQSTSKRADDAMKLAFLFRDANEKFATDYPAAVGSHMTNTDSSQFMDLVPAISLRENERGMQIGAGWDPHWHQPTDRYATFSDKDFRLGLNAAQTTLGAIARLAGAAVKK